MFAGSDEAVVAALAAANDRIVVDAADIFPAPAEVAEFTFTGVFDMQRRGRTGTNPCTVTMAGLALDRGAFEYILQVTTVAGDFDMGEVEWETGILMVELLRHELGADR